MRSLLAMIALGAAVLLSACSGPDPIELPEDPEGVILLDHVRAETQLDIILISVRQVSDVDISYERLFDITETGAEDLIDHYDQWLTAEGWERQSGTAGITGSLGASWERDGQDVVIALLSLEDTDIAAVLTSPR